LVVLKIREKVEIYLEKVVNRFHFILFFIKRRNLIPFFPNLFLQKRKYLPISLASRFLKKHSKIV